MNEEKDSKSARNEMYQQQHEEFFKKLEKLDKGERSEMSRCINLPIGVSSDTGIGSVSHAQLFYAKILPHKVARKNYQAYFSVAAWYCFYDAHGKNGIPFAKALRLLKAEKYGFDTKNKTRLDNALVNAINSGVERDLTNEDDMLEFIKAMSISIKSLSSMGDYSLDWDQLLTDMIMAGKDDYKDRVFSGWMQQMYVKASKEE